MFILCPDPLSLNGSVMINQSINQIMKCYFCILGHVIINDRSIVMLIDETENGDVNEL